ncbi:pilus assembly protein TadG-related protein [Microbacterium sp. T2.11-28]|uniref:pilus assembly protein TadG-related protein n=1 Tax=Microbacterium sp. T2.11-28 TaxID=3041169 RepID=UPI00314509DF
MNVPSAQSRPAEPRSAGATDDSGTAMLLTIGFAVLALALILVCADATSLYLAHKRADAAADAAALAGADGFEVEVVDGTAAARLTDAEVRRQAAALLNEFGGVELVSASAPDGTSARVTVRLRWRPPVLSLFVPDGVTIDATATTRTALG